MFKKQGVVPVKGELVDEGVIKNEKGLLWLSTFYV